MISIFPEMARSPSDVVGLGYPIIDKWCTKAVLSATLNGSYTAEFTIPHKAKGVKRELLPDVKQVIKLIDMDGDEEYFRVRRFKHNLKKTVITAEHISYDLIDNLIEDINNVDKDGQGIMDKISAGTQYKHPFRLTSDILKTANIRMVRMNPIQALIGTADNTFVNRLGGELKRKQFTLAMNESIGIHRTDVIRSRRNLTGFEREINLEDYATRIMPRAKNGIELPEKYVDSPHIDPDHPVIKVIDYSDVEYDGEFKDLSDSDKNRVYNELRACAKADFAAGRDVPNASYEVDFITLRNTVEYADYRALENYNLGDTVSIYEADYDVEIEAKVISFEWDVLKKRYTSMKLGSFKNGIVRSNFNKTNSVDAKISQAQSTADIALLSADGKTTNFYGTGEPVNPKKGDTWFKKNGSEEEVWQYQEVDGVMMWVYVTGTRYANALKESIAHDFSKVTQQITEQQQAHDRTVADILTKVGALQNLATEAKTIGNQAKLDAADALSQANQAKIDAITEANRLVELSKTTLASQIKSVDVKVDDVANQITAKVSQTDFDKLKGTVTGQQTTIDQTAAKIALKADKTVTDNLSQQISQTQADLSVTNDKIKALVTKTDFNGLTGRMTTAETQLVTQAGQIAERLTRTEINSLVDSKGYQTASQVQQMVTRSADTLTQTISQVESRIPNEFSGNILADSGRGWNNQHMQSFTLADSIYKGSTYTVTVRWWRSDNSTLNMGLRASETDSWQWIDLAYNPKIDAWTFTFVSQKYIASGSVIYLFTVENNGIGSASWATLVKGPVPLSVWQASKADLTTVTAFNEVEDTVRSHTQTISEQGKSISQVIQTANGLINRVADLTASGNLIYDPTNYSKYVEREPNSNLVLTGTSEYKLLRITQSGRTTGGWRGFKMPLHSQKFVKGEKLSYRVNLWVDVLPDAKVGFEIKNGGTVLASFAIMPTKTGSNQIFTGTFTVNTTSLVTDDYGLHIWLEKNGTVAFGQLSIVRGDTPPQSFVDSTSAMQLATETQVSQLAGSWAVKNLTSGGAVLNQINLSANGTNLIDGRLTHITGQTLIDNGVIKSGMIGNGQIGTAHIGTIDASQANIINLNVNKLIGFDAAFIKGKIETAMIDWMKGKVISSSDEKMKIHLDTNRIEMNSNAAAIMRKQDGFPIEYINFTNATNTNGTRSSNINIGIDRSQNFANLSNSGDFSGIRIFNNFDSQNNLVDQVEVVGDNIILSHAATSAIDSRGWIIRAFNNTHSPTIEPYFNSNTPNVGEWKKNTIIKSGDFWILSDNGKYISVASLLKMLNLNMAHLVNIVGRADVLKHMGDFDGHFAGTDLH
ncbi:phage tail spike protein [Streptococcus orisratti]